MRLHLISAPALALSLLYCGNANFLTAQNASDARVQMEHCIHWINAIVTPRQTFDPVNFCAGFETGNTSGLYTQNFIGLTMPGDTVAFSLRTPSKDGHEFLAATEDPTDDPQRIAATFFSRTPFTIQNVRLPAGMYKLFPYQLPEGWQLAIARQDGEWNDPLNPSQRLAQVEMNTVAMDYPYAKLYAYLHLISPHCGPAKPAWSIRELEFAFGDTDVSVCLRPEQIRPTPQDNLSER